MTLSHPDKIMSVYPTNLLSTQLLIVCQDPPRLTKVNPTLLKLLDDSTNIEPIDKPETTLNSEDLACPARFERATSALETGKMSSNNKPNHRLKVFNFGVA